MPPYRPNRGLDINKPLRTTPESGLEKTMKPMRLQGCRIAAAACVLVVAGLSQADAQFPPPPGQSQSAAQDAAFPPAPGQGRAPAQDSAFPPPPGQSRVSAQDPAFPPPGQRAPSGGISIAPSGGGSFGPPPAGGGFAPPGPGGGFSGPPAPPSEQQRVCSTFPALREEVQKSGGLITSASERKAAREEVCPLFKAFAVKEGKMLSFLETNERLCGVPPKIIAHIKTGHAKTIQMRNVVCSAAPMGAAGPTLSDALGGPIIADDSTAKRPGRGTFDTLTGNALQK
jgi:hypothetical protein